MPISTKLLCVKQSTGTDYASKYRITLREKKINLQEQIMPLSIELSYVKQSAGTDSFDREQNCRR